MSEEVWKSNFRVPDFQKTLSPLSQYHQYHEITTITASPLSQNNHYHNHNITTITKLPLSQYHHYHNITTIATSPLSRYHHYHNIITITISPLSQHHHDHNITTITISPLYHRYTTAISPLYPITVSPLYHHYHNITTITKSPLSQKHHYHNHNIITITTSPLSQHHHYHNITTITKPALSQYHHYHKHHHYHNITTITISPLSQYHHYHMSRTKAPFSHLPVSLFWGKSRTIASFSHLPLSDFEGSLAVKLRFHIFHCQILKEVSHESFVFTSSTFRFWGKSRTKALFSHLPLSDVEGSLARKLCFDIFHFQMLREVSRESFVFTSSPFTFGYFWREISIISHELRFWKLADARNVVFCRRKRVSEDGWGSLSSRRVRNTLV